VRGAWGWAAVAALILVFDLAAPEDETLTDACHRALRKHPWMVVLLVASTTLHLLLGWDNRYSRVDAFRAIGGARRYTRGLKTRQRATQTAQSLFTIEETIA